MKASAVPLPPECLASKPLIVTLFDSILKIFLFLGAITIDSEASSITRVEDVEGLGSTPAFAPLMVNSLFTTTFSL